RSELREKIMIILYQINVYRKEKLEYNIETIMKEINPSDDEFVKKIVTNTLEKEEGIDELINKYMKEWTIKRLGNIDQAIFRMSVYELLYTDTPHIVSINEGIELSKKFSDEKITKMLNAVLDEILNNEVHNE
ncbi:MAG: transcription antitermination factor NusB, partial [Bacilli bacterium]|nr:transcription antitermination factor NusB [Bacilli bacterium]